VSGRIPDMNDVDGTRMSFSRCNDTHSTQVVTSGNKAKVSSFKLDKVDNLALIKVVSDSVMNLDQGVWVSNGSAIMSDQVRDSFASLCNLLDSKKFVRGLILGDSMENKPSLDIIHESEIVSSLVNRDHI